MKDVPYTLYIGGDVLFMDHVIAAVYGLKGELWAKGMYHCANTTKYT